MVAEKNIPKGNRRKVRLHSLFLRSSFNNCCKVNFLQWSCILQWCLPCSTGTCLRILLCPCITINATINTLSTKKWKITGESSTFHSAIQVDFLEHFWGHQTEPQDLDKRSRRISESQNVTVHTVTEGRGEVPFLLPSNATDTWTDDRLTILGLW